jgi:hypothetical protein
MIKLSTLTVGEVCFPPLQLEKGDWISIALPYRFHELIPAYCRHIKASSDEGIFKRRVLFKWLNLTHTNKIYSRQESLRELIEREPDVDEDFLKNYVRQELGLNDKRRITTLSNEDSIPFLYQLQKHKADLIVCSRSGLEATAKKRMADLLLKDRAEQRIIEFCSPYNGIYDVVEGTQELRLSKKSEV